MFIAEDIDRFKALFIQKLKDMLCDDGLGAFILVLANSLQNDVLRQALQDDLRESFLALKDRYHADELNATQDDLDVFIQLLELDLATLPVWQIKNSGNWELALNVMRQLRPQRNSAVLLDSIKQPFDNAGFHFNKPFLAPEILWQGEYKNKNVRVLYNKFPFAAYHLIIAVSPELCRAQVLDEEMHQYMSALVEQVSADLPGFAVGFNSLAAGASVNHLHFQGFVRSQPFPIERADEYYPLSRYACENSKQSWRIIKQFTEQDVAFNCLYLNDKCYVVPRKYQGSVELPTWLNGAGWIDVAGVMTLSDETDFAGLSASEIDNGLRLLDIA